MLFKSLDKPLETHIATKFDISESIETIRKDQWHSYWPTLHYYIGILLCGRGLINFRFNFSTKIEKCSKLTINKNLTSTRKAYTLIKEQLYDDVCSD